MLVKSYVHDFVKINQTPESQEYIERNCFKNPFTNGEVIDENAKVCLAFACDEFFVEEVPIVGSIFV